MLSLWKGVAFYTRAIPKVRSPKRYGTVFAALGSTVSVRCFPHSPTPSKRVHRDRMFSLCLAAFCNGAPAEHYRELQNSCNFSVFERKRQHTDWNLSSIDRSISKRSETGVGSLHLVALKFMTKNEAGDCQLAKRWSRRLRNPCVKIGGSLWMISAFRFLRFLEPFIGFWWTSCNIGKCVQDGSHECWQKTTNSNE